MKTTRLVKNRRAVATYLWERKYVSFSPRSVRKLKRYAHKLERQWSKMLIAEALSE